MLDVLGVLWSGVAGVEVDVAPVAPCCRRGGRP